MKGGKKVNQEYHTHFVTFDRCIISVNVLFIEIIFWKDSQFLDL